MSVLRGYGQGTFGAHTNFGTGRAPVSVAIGDINEDGKLDLAVANYGSNTVSVLANTGAVAGVSQGPSAGVFRLLAPQPNPAHGALQVHFILPRSERVEADILDIMGRRIRTLGSEQALGPGEHVLAWDARDNAGAPVPDGVFVIRVRAAGDSRVTRAVLVR